MATIVAEQTDEQSLVLDLPSDARTPSKAAAELETFSDRAIAEVSQAFESFTVTPAEAELEQDSWERSFCLAKGWRVGVEVELSWDSEFPAHGVIDVTEYTKLDDMLIWLIGIPLAVVFGALAFFSVPPLTFLPASKLGFILGGVIGAVCAVLIILPLRTLLHRSQSAENERLQSEVSETIRGLLA